MACACKVNKQIEFLRRKYGENQPKSKKTNIANIVLTKIKSFALFVLTIPFIPLMIFNITKTNVRKKPIRIDRFFNLAQTNTNGKQQSII